MEQEVFPFHNLNNFDLASLLNDNVLHNFPLHVLDKTTHKPFLYLDGDRASDNLSIQYNISEPNSNYLFSDNIISSPDSLNLFVLNISSVPLHLESCLDQCINTSNCVYDVLGFCETHLSDGLCEIYSIDGYNNYFNNKNTHGGGVAIYIKKTFQVGQTL